MKIASFSDLLYRMKQTIRDFQQDRKVYKSAIFGIEKYKRVFDEYPRMVIDIGAHIGSLSFYALDHGASNVLSIEADIGNYIQLFKNALRYETKKGQIIYCLNRAFAATNNKHELLRVCAFGNTGQRSIAYNIPEVSNGISQVVQTIDLEHIFKSTIKNHLIVDYLKIDIEGGEYQALPMNSDTRRYLSKVKFLDIEFHPLDRPYFDFKQMQDKYPGIESGNDLIKKYLIFFNKCGFVKENDKLSYVNGYKLCVPNRNMKTGAII